MAIAANARLQARILAQMLELHPTPIKVIADLARSLASPRSSVSRAMHALDDAGLVKKGMPGWELTPLGLDIAKGMKSAEPVVRAAQSSLRTLDLNGFSDYANQASALRGFAEMGTTTAALIQSIVRQVSAYEKIQKALGASMYDQFSALDGVTQRLIIPSAAENIASALNNIRDSYPDISIYAPSIRLAQESLGSFAFSQRQNLALMTIASSVSSLSPNVFSELGITNAWLSRIVNDLGAINSFSTTQHTLSNTVESLLSSVAELSHSYETYVRDLTSNFHEILFAQPYDLMLAVPTRTTARYVGIVRDLALPEDNDELSLDYLDVKSAERPLARDFFSSFGSQFAKMWDGALLSINSENPDRVRQAAHSCRELLMQLLAFLAPDDTFTPEEIAQHGARNVTRKMRVRRIMDGRRNSAATLADNLAGMIAELYDELVAISHNRSPYERIGAKNMEGLLFMVYGVFRFMIDDKE